KGVLEEQNKVSEAEAQEEDETANAIENENKPKIINIEEKLVTYAIWFPVDDDLVEE
nr:hypothetical protein [Tanacetum cinerariifolium]